jgi:hypothetical protein
MKDNTIIKVMVIFIVAISICLHVGYWIVKDELELNRKQLEIVSANQINTIEQINRIAGMVDNLTVNFQRTQIVPESKNKKMR